MYAQEGSEANKAKIAKLMEMGFPEDKVKEALAKNAFNEENALNTLLNS